MLDHSGGRVPLRSGFDNRSRSPKLDMLLHEDGSVPDTFVPKMYNELSFDMLAQPDGSEPLNRGLEYSSRSTMLVMSLHVEGSVPETLVA